MRDVIVYLQGVTKWFGIKTVLDKVNFTVERGQLLGLIGKSGAGKTTLLNLILGLYDPDLGFVRTSNIKIGYASQDTSFYPRLTVDENLKYFGALYKVPKTALDKRIDDVLRMLDLFDAKKTKAQNLSGGMKRRLDLALALIHNPELIILDEPTTGLDIVLQKQLWSNILKIKNAGKTIIVSSHDLEQLKQYCDSFAFIHNRKLYDLDGVKKALHIKNITKLEQVFECCQ